MAKEMSVFKKQRRCMETNEKEGNWMQQGTVGGHSAH